MTQRPFLIISFLALSSSCFASEVAFIPQSSNQDTHDVREINLDALHSEMIDGKAAIIVEGNALPGHAADHPTCVLRNVTDAPELLKLLKGRDVSLKCDFNQGSLEQSNRYHLWTWELSFKSSSSEKPFFGKVIFQEPSINGEVSRTILPKGLVLMQQIDGTANIFIPTQSDGSNLSDRRTCLLKNVNDAPLFIQKLALNSEKTWVKCDNLKANSSLDYEQTSWDGLNLPKFETKAD